MATRFYTRFEGKLIECETSEDAALLDSVNQILMRVDQAQPKRSLSDRRQLEAVLKRYGRQHLASEVNAILDGAELESE